MRKSCLKFNDEQLAVLFRQLASLLKAGVPLYHALQILKSRQPLAGSLADDISRGISLSCALEKQKAPTDIVGLIAVAEHNAALEETLCELSSYLMSRVEASHQIKRALAYPGFVLSISGVCLLALFVFVLPMFRSMFEGYNMPLPLITRIFMAMPDYWYVFAGLFCAVVFLGRKIWKRDDIKLKMPVAGRIYSLFIHERFCRTLGQQLKNGVPILAAVSNTKKAVNNTVYRASLDVLHDKLERGEKLSQSMGSQVFSADLVQMVAVGEETSTLDKMLSEAAEMYRRESESALKQLALLIEPLSTLTVGLVVGVVAFAMLSPLFAMMNGLQ